MSGFVVNILNSIPVLGAFTGNGFRPPQWTGPQLTSISANLPGLSATGTSARILDPDTGAVLGNATPTANSNQAATTVPTTYFFDAILRVDHSQELRATDHPVQSGASITDHAYLLPARVSLEIGMSDAMDSYQSGQWSGASSKSVNAYQTLLMLQALRVPMAVNTRLNGYTNMVIESIRSGDDARTLHALNAIVQFRQIIVGSVTTSALSARPHTTGLYSLGLVQPIPPPAALNPLIEAVSNFFGVK